MSILNRDEEAALIDLEFTEHRGGDADHSDSEGYSSCLSSSQNDDPSDESGTRSSSSQDGESSSSQEDDEDEDEESTSSSSGSGAGGYPLPLFGRISIMRRRGAHVPSNGNQGRHDYGHDDLSQDDSKNRPKRPSLPARDRSMCRVANVFLICSIILWLVVMILAFMAPSDHGARPLDSQKPRSYFEKVWDTLLVSFRRHPKLTRGQIAQLRKQRTEEARKALGSAAEVRPGFFNLFGLAGTTTRKKKKASVEDLPPSCKFRDWQKASYPNCNELHELDLYDVLVSSHSQSINKQPTELSYDADYDGRIGYVDSGLWRTVWKVDPRQERQGGQVPAVLKMMKGEHDVDSRNIDRHRRDALVMERLTSSPHIVSMFAYCANSVLTEYISADLATVVAQDESITTFPTRQTPQGRLQLALGVAKGVRAIHEMEGGPVIHADIVSTQFLVDKAGNTKLNDFNRCRFIAHKNSTGEACPVRIPSAPGSSRSPEEYAYVALTEKLDIYSVGNVLYEILTGVEPWLSIPTAEAQKSVLHGEKPPIAEQYLTQNTIDAGLAKIIDLTFATNPKDRINATALVDQLEALLGDFRT